MQMTFDPETLGYTLDLLEEMGLLIVEDNPNNTDAVIVRAAPRLIQMIEEQGVTLDDFTR
jgi:hypothetical protein